MTSITYELDEVNSTDELKIYTQVGVDVETIAAQVEVATIVPRLVGSDSGPETGITVMAAAKHRGLRAHEILSRYLSAFNVANPDLNEYLGTTEPVEVAVFYAINPLSIPVH